MQVLQAIMETEEVKSIITECEDLINEAEGEVLQFPEQLKQFIINNPEEFIGENAEDTKKNIAVFTETATQHYLYNVCDVISESAVSRIEEAEANDPVNRYF
jgi:hypothetical protein